MMVVQSELRVFGVGREGVSLGTPLHPEGATLRWEVGLLGGFSVVSGAEVVDLPIDSQRLVAFLALQGGRVRRAYVAGCLWLDVSQERAFGNLRSALWRLRRHTTDLVDADTHTLALASSAAIDVTTLIDSADRLCSPESDCGEFELDPVPFTQELLPGWYEEWSVVHRERLRQRSLHALEALAERLTTRGRYDRAIQASLAAIDLDPLRESSNRCLIRVHIAEGNYSEALTQYHHYRNQLHTELGIAPSPHLQRLMSEIPV
jgi:DNA-binding SARP family transcriptional activator